MMLSWVSVCLFIFSSFFFLFLFKEYLVFLNFFFLIKNYITC